MYRLANGVIHASSESLVRLFLTRVDEASDWCSLKMSPIKFIVSIVVIEGVIPVILSFLLVWRSHF